MQMKNTKSSVKISIPLLRLKKTLVNSVVKRKAEYIIINNDKKDQIEFVPEPFNKMNKERKRKVSEDPIPTSEVTESHAHLLLNLSNSMPLSQKEHLPDQLLHQPAKNPKQQPINIHQITKNSQQTEIIVLDADDDTKNTKILKHERFQRDVSEKHKPPDLVPLQRAKYESIGDSLESQTKIPLIKAETGFNRKDKESQTDKIYVVSNVDYEIINMVKDKGLTVRQLSCMPGAQEQSSRVEEQPEDVNNNSTDQSNLQIPLIDLCLDDNDYNILDDETYNRLVMDSVQYKVVAAKVFEAMRHYDVEKCSLHPTDVLQGSKVNICDICRTAPKASCLDKVTQTPFRITREVGCSTNELFCNKVHGGVISIQNDSTTKSTHLHESSMQSHVRIHQVPISPVPGKLTEAQEQMLHHYKLPPQPTAQSTNYSNAYPGTLMMSALELPEHRQQFQHWKNAYASEGLGGMEQQCYIANVATVTSALPSQAASHPISTQHPSGSVHQSSITQPASTATAERWLTDDSLRAQRAPRRLKNTPTRGAPYQVTGPRFPAPRQNKYQILMEQQKLRTMLEKQKEWESHLQNYPNTAWGKSYKGNL